MRLQVFSDLHLESEDFDPQPLRDAELLVLAGDIDSRWKGYECFAGWPVPVVAVAGNHEFDGRELRQAWPALRTHLERHGITLLERETMVVRDDRGRAVRILGTTRWSDFRVFGEQGQGAAMRAAGYFQKVMRATEAGASFDAAAVKREGERCRAWLEHELPVAGEGCDAVVVVTHFAPSLRSADPRFGAQPSTASFCNADDDLLPHAQLWIHGHVHARHDYRVGATRVIGAGRGLDHKGESRGWVDPGLIEV
jgi:predicted phosphodiesterase